MRAATFIFAGIFGGLFVAFCAVPQVAQARAQHPAGRVVDRIVAHIEGDIILQSQVRELAAFQQLIDGHAESDNQLLAELIEQWVVQTEATTAHFPQPAQAEIDRETARLAGQFPAPGAYQSKLNELGLSPTQVRHLLERQFYVERYLDYKFRPSAQIETTDIENYYRNQLTPELTSKNQPVPPLADVQDQIRELLTQRAITALAEKWLDETKSRLKIEIMAPDGQSTVQSNAQSTMRSAGTKP